MNIIHTCEKMIIGSMKKFFKNIAKFAAALSEILTEHNDERSLYFYGVSLGAPIEEK